MYKDYYLRFKSKEEAIQVFSLIPDHTYVSENDELEIVSQTQTFAILEVGKIYNNDGVYEYNKDGEMIVISSPTPMKGYHYNYRLVWGQGEEIPFPEVLTPYSKTPKTPSATIF
jgi:DNA-directed RNA polymerase subunit H (RpoH/RPB5)